MEFFFLELTLDALYVSIEKRFANLEKMGLNLMTPNCGGARQFILGVSLKFCWRPKIFSTLKIW
jgi:hypothetical protein